MVAKVNRNLGPISWVLPNAVQSHSKLYIPLLLFPYWSYGNNGECMWEWNADSQQMAAHIKQFTKKHFINTNKKIHSALALILYPAAAQRY